MVFSCRNGSRYPKYNHKFSYHPVIYCKSHQYGYAPILVKFCAIFAQIANMVNTASAKTCEEGEVLVWAFAHIHR